MPVSPATVVLLTSPSTRFRSLHRYDAPAYVQAATYESSAVLPAAADAVVLDADQPLLPDDLTRALRNASGGLVARVLIFGAGVLTADAGTQKTTAFWNARDLRDVLTSWVRDGGILLILDTPDGESVPAWLQDLARGGWARERRAGQVTPVGGYAGVEFRRFDMIDFGATRSERDHKLSGAAKRLPPLDLERAEGGRGLSDDGMLARRPVEFLLKQEPGKPHRLTFRYDHLVRPRLIVEVRTRMGWELVGTVKAIGRPEGPRWREGSHQLPPARADQSWIRVRVRAEGGGAFRLYAAWIDALVETRSHPALAPVGWSTRTDFGPVGAALRGGAGRIPLLFLDGSPDLAAMLAAPAGQGAVVRTTLPLVRLRRLITALRDGETAAAFCRALRGPSGR